MVIVFLHRIEQTEVPKGVVYKLTMLLVEKIWNTLGSWIKKRVNTFSWGLSQHGRRMEEWKTVVLKAMLISKGQVQEVFKCSLGGKGAPGGVTLCKTKIRKQIMYFRYTMAQNIYYHSKRERDEGAY